MRRRFFVFLTIMCTLVIINLCGCTTYNMNNNANIMIGDMGYNSLAEAIRCANDGDTILIFDDVFETEENIEGEVYAVFNDNVYVAYNITKPLVIKGVDKDNGELPKIYGTLSIDIGKEEYKDNSVTIDNLSIEHGYMSLTDDGVNQPFMVGVRVIDGSANLVGNDIHQARIINDDIIRSNNLSLCYGVVLSRQKESKLVGENLCYDISKNTFGLYSNKKDDSYSCPFLIVQNYQDNGSFEPAIINTKSNNYAIQVYNENMFRKEQIIYASDYDYELQSCKSICVNEGYDISNSQSNNENCTLIYNGELLFDNITNVDVYGKLVINSDVKNIIFNLKSPEANVEIFGEMKGVVEINQYKK